MIITSRSSFAWSNKGGSVLCTYLPYLAKGVGQQAGAAKQVLTPTLEGHYRTVIKLLPPSRNTRYARLEELMFRRNHPANTHRCPR